MVGWSKLNSRSNISNQIEIESKIDQKVDLQEFKNQK